MHIQNKRKIEFKAICLKSKKWVNGHFCKIANKAYIIQDGVRDYEVDEKTVCQLITNGIYEFDTSSGNYVCIENGYPIIRQINGRAVFPFTDKFEPTGNIFDYKQSY